MEKKEETEGEGRNGNCRIPHLPFSLFSIFSLSSQTNFL
jgi:hypothetical protein